MDSLDKLKKDARALELRVEFKLNEYVRLDNGAAHSDLEAAATSPEALDAANAKEIEEYLEQMADTTDRMARIVSDHPSRADTAMVKRFREVIHDFKTTFRRHQAAARQRREKAALFRDMREAKAGGDAGATDTLLRERGSLVTSHRAIDDVISQAAETREALSRQRAALQNASSGLGNIIERIPGVGGLVDAIQGRRRGNDRIVALVIAACVCFCLWYFVLRRR